MSPSLIAAQQRQEREACKRQRELERLAKERAKLSAIENARVEVETYENHIDLLASVHKEQGENQDWDAIAAVLRPVRPERLSLHESRVRQCALLPNATGTPGVSKEDTAAMIAQARQQDETEFQQGLQSYSDNKVQWKKMKRLAIGVLAGDPMTYLEALAELNPLDELRNVGSPPHFTVHGSKLMECVFTVNGSTVIPSEVKTLTATGKASIKPMPKARFQEIYQAYVCGCVLRIAREIFAFLPVETVIVTASADVLDPHTGTQRSQPVLSASISRSTISGLDFERLDPSAAVENFLHRTGFKRPGKGIEFSSVIPLTPSDLPVASRESLGIGHLVSEIKIARESVHRLMSTLTPNRERNDISRDLSA